MTAKSLTPQVKPKHAGGRPKIDYVSLLPNGWKDSIIQMCAKGYSDVEIRANICMVSGKFNHERWYALEERSLEFSETLKKGRVLCEAWWITQGRNSLENPKFQAGLWYINMKNRFGWKDKVDHEHSGSIGLYDKYKDLSVEELQRRASELGIVRSSAN